MTIISVNFKKRHKLLNNQKITKTLIKYNKDKFISELKSANWEVLTSRSIDEKCNFLEEVKLFKRCLEV